MGSICLGRENKTSIDTAILPMKCPSTSYYRKEEEEPQGLPRIIRVGSFYKLCTNSLAQFVVATPSTQKPTTGRRQQGLEALRGSEGFEGVEQ